MRQGDTERFSIENSLKQIFQEERSAVSKEMESFLDSFQKQSEAAAERGLRLPEDYKSQLEIEKEEAKRMYNETEIHKVTSGKPAASKKMAKG